MYKKKTPGHWEWAPVTGSHVVLLFRISSTSASDQPVPFYMTFDLEA